MSSPVAAVIVAYASNAELPRCLEALHGKVAETVVIDNCPAAAVPAALRASHPWVNWISNSSNRGFAAAVNQGVEATSAPLVLLLNPDCELVTGLDGLVEACNVRGVGGAGGLLVDLNDLPQTGFFARSLPTPTALAFEALGLNRIWQGNPVNRRFRLRSLDPGIESEVEQPAGAFLMLQRKALEAVGGLDEGFRPVWFEDVDLCRRLRDAGYTLRYTPRAVAQHLGGHAVRKLTLRLQLIAWYGGLLRYAKKHFSNAAYRRVRVAVLVGLALRKLYCFAGGRASDDSDTYGYVFRLARRGFPGGIEGS